MGIGVRLWWNACSRQRADTRRTEPHADAAIRLVAAVTEPDDRARRRPKRGMALVKTPIRDGQGRPPRLELTEHEWRISVRPDLDDHRERQSRVGVLERRRQHRRTIPCHGTSHHPSNLAVAPRLRQQPTWASLSIDRCDGCSVGRVRLRLPRVLAAIRLLIECSLEPFFILLVHLHSPPLRWCPSDRVGAYDRRLAPHRMRPYSGNTTDCDQDWISMTDRRCQERSSISRHRSNAIRYVRWLAGRPSDGARLPA
jgi:hypothetical protein